MGFFEQTSLKSSKQGSRLTLFLFNDFIILARKPVETTKSSKAKKKEGIIDRKSILNTHELIFGAPLPRIKISKAMKGDYIELNLIDVLDSEVMIPTNTHKEDVTGLYRLAPRKPEKLNKFMSCLTALQNHLSAQSNTDCRFEIFLYSFLACRLSGQHVSEE